MTGKYLKSTFLRPLVKYNVHEQILQTEYIDVEDNEKVMSIIVVTLKYRLSFAGTNHTA